MFPKRITTSQENRVHAYSKIFSNCALQLSAAFWPDCKIWPLVVLDFFPTPLQHTHDQEDGAWQHKRRNSIKISPDYSLTSDMERVFKASSGKILFVFRSAHRASSS
jgi:hypothetical protein